MSGTTTILAVGDVGPNRDAPATLFANVAPHLAQADIAFCQLETCFATTGERVPQAAYTWRMPPETAVDLRKAGFHVVSTAGNHCMDWGPTALLETIESLESAGLAGVGTGKDLAAARKPVVVENNGMRVGFLAYCSILPEGYEATDGRAGCAPLRVHTAYEAIEPDQPGTPARVVTFPHEGDARRLEEDVRALRPQVDLLFVSFHWGLHFEPVTLADYQPVLARRAIDAGADAVLGHHPHILKGVEVYEDRPIFYSLGNFAIELPWSEALAQSPSFQHLRTLNQGPWVVGPHSRYNGPVDGAMSAIVRFVASPGGGVSVSLLPVLIDTETAVPSVVTGEDPEFGRIADYLREISQARGFTTRFDVRRDDILMPDVGFPVRGNGGR